MTRLANRHGSINLAQGFPDFDPPPELLDALDRATRGPHHQYAVTWGAPRFRQALARKIQRFTNLPVDPDRHLVVTCGSTEAMMVAMMTACNPGDKVVVFSPFYENYGADAILSGAEPVYVPLQPPDFTSHPKNAQIPREDHDRINSGGELDIHQDRKDQEEEEIIIGIGFFIDET